MNVRVYVHVFTSAGTSQLHPVHSIKMPPLSAWWPVWAVWAVRAADSTWRMAKWQINQWILDLINIEKTTAWEIGHIKPITAQPGMCTWPALVEQKENQWKKFDTHLFVCIKVQIANANEDAWITSSLPAKTGPFVRVVWRVAVVDKVIEAALQNCSC